MEAVQQLKGQYGIKWDKMGYCSDTFRGMGLHFFGYATDLLPIMFDSGSTALRERFDNPSSRSRRIVEAQSKKTRSCPEAVSNMSRSTAEQ